MSTPFVGEVRIFSFGFAPKNWAFCNGQLLSIVQNQALFALLGTTYGGDGRVTFGLPNLQGRTTLGIGNGFSWGEVGGESTHTLSISEMATHNHPAVASTTTGNTATPTGSVLGANSNQFFGGTNLVSLLPTTVGLAGSSLPHPNMQPYLTLNYCIALYGIFPSRS